MMIQAVIFDCFGVLVEDSMNAFFRKYLASQPEIVKQIKILDHESAEGKISWSELVDNIVQLTNIDRVEIEQFLDKNPQNLPLFDYISTELKPYYKLGFLSNTADDWLKELFSPEQLALFDDFVLSYQHNIRKPDRAIFELAAKRLNVLPTECILVDDVMEYCQGANEVGMHTIQYVSFDQVKSDIARLIK
jgi:HAD superfamily hydrolase (TIGR01509 family)